MRLDAPRDRFNNRKYWTAYCLASGRMAPQFLQSLRGLLTIRPLRPTYSNFHPSAYATLSNMRITIFALWFTVAVSANPFAWAAPQAGAAPSASTVSKKKQNGTHRHHHHYKEPTPTFKLRCDCKTPVVPNLLNPSEVGWCASLCIHGSNMAKGMSGS